MRLGWITIIFFLVIIFTTFIFRDFLAKFFLNVGNPAAQSAYSIKKMFGFRTSKVLEEENRELRALNTQLVLQTVQLKEEVVALHHGLSTESLFLEKHLERVPARVIGKALPQEEQYILNRGSKDGIILGAPVIGDDGIFVGKIAAVSDHHSAYRSILDPASMISAEIIGQTPIQGIAKGEHGVGITLDYISVDVDVKPGQIVVTSGLEGGIPSGLIVGTVETIERVPEDLFLKVSIRKPLQNINPSVVSVLKMPKL